MDHVFWYLFTFLNQAQNISHQKFDTVRLSHSFIDLSFNIIHQTKLNTDNNFKKPLYEKPVTQRVLRIFIRSSLVLVSIKLTLIIIDEKPFNSKK